MAKPTLILFALCLVIYNVNSARILGVVSTPSYSHQMFFQQLWRALALRGHEMVVITTDPTNETLPNFKELDISQLYVQSNKFRKQIVNENIIKIILTGTWNEASYQQMDYQFSIPIMREFIANKSEHFDLVMIEHFYSVNFGFKHRFNCPFIGIASLDGLPMSQAVMGNPVHAVLYPAGLVSGHEEMSFMQRLGTVVISNLFEYIMLKDAAKFDALTRKYFGEDTPSILELMEETDMLFVNANPVFSSVRPFAPATISIAGGMHMKPPKKLPKELGAFLDGATEGVVYFSLGGNVRSNELPMETRKMIIEVLGQLPYKVLWKFEDDSLVDIPKNLMITKWAPQQDVLRHKNVKLFITQGGLQSLEETLFSHVPVIVIPFFGDQQANADKVKAKGMGLVLDRFNLNAENFKGTIVEMMTNPKYGETVKKLALQIQDEPMTPLEKAIWWTEYVLRHKGAKHLKGPKIPVYQYYYLDVLAFVGLVLAIIATLVIISLKFVCRKIKSVFCKANVDNQKKKRV